jgi:hypothetical protein
VLFSRDLRLDSVHLARQVPESMTLEKWLAPERTLLEAGTRLATLSDGVLLYGLHTRFRCTYWTLGVQEGDTIRRGELIAQLATDGEEIPEGVAWCELKPFFVPD